MIIQLMLNNPSLLQPYKNLSHVVLLQNGIYCHKTLCEDFPHAHVYALEQDWQASGLELPHKVTIISYSQWVALCAEHHPVLTLQ